MLIPYSKTIWSQPRFSNFQIDTSSSGHNDSGDETRWSNTNNLVDVDPFDNTYASLRLVTYGSAISSNRVNASGEIIISNNEIYNKENFINFDFTVVDRSTIPLTTIDNINFEVSSSLDGISFTPFEMVYKTENDNSIQLDGMPSANFKYIKIKISINAQSALGIKKATIRFHKINFTNTLTSGLCNIFKPLVNSSNTSLPADFELVSSRTGYLDGVFVSLGLPYSNLDRVLDYNLNNYGSLAAGISLNILDVILNLLPQNRPSSVGVSVKSSNKIYPANTYVGYKVSKVDILSVSVLSGFKIKTYLNGVLQEEVTISSVGLNVGIVTANTPFDVGIITTKPCDEIQLVYIIPTIEAGGVNVYYPFAKEYCEGATLNCNEVNYLSSKDYPLDVYYNIPGGGNIEVGNGVDNLYAIIDGNDTTAAQIISTASISLAKTSEIIVKKQLAPYTGVNHVGFAIQTPGLAELNLLKDMTIDLYYKGNLVSSQTGTSLISASIPLLNGIGSKQFGVVSKDTFDEVRLKMFSPVGVNLINGMLINEFFVEPLCNTSNTVLFDNMDCNEIVPFSKPNYPLYIDYQHTLKDDSPLSSLIQIGDISNPHYAIDGDTSTAAVITVPANLLGEGTTFGIGDAINIYPKNTYVSFDVKTPSLLNLSVLEDFKIRLYLDTVLVQEETDVRSLIGLNPGLLTGVGANDRKQFSIVSKDSFNKVVIDFGSVAVNLGPINIYEINISKLCPIDLQCNTTYRLEKFTSPIGINYHRTGNIGLVGLSNGVSNAENVIDTISDNYAEITTIANVIAGTSLSVKNPIQSFPIGTYAGFLVANGITGLVDLDLINYITISTYKDNVLQESKSAGNLLNLDLLIKLIGPSHQALPYGFIASKRFYEVVIAVADVLGVAKNIRVYSAFADTRFALNANGTFCNFHTQPDIATTLPTTLTTGDVSTNDNVPDGAIYGPAIADINNPASNALTLNDDGTYTFTSNIPGKYNYSIPVCYTNDSITPAVSQCKSEILTITVVDTNEFSNNKPIVNHDVATLLSGTNNTITIPVLSNDGPGNNNGILDASSVVVNQQPSKGTVTVLADGTINYTALSNASGVDSFWYTISEKPSMTSDSAIVKVYLQEVATYPIIVGDDYVSIYNDAITSIPASKGVLVNDYSVEDTITLAVIPVTETIPNKAIITINANGSYTIEPLNNFEGALSIVYEVTDGINKNQGTLNILLIKPNNVTYYTSPDILASYPNVPTTGNVAANDFLPEGAIYGPATPNTSNPLGGNLSINSNGEYNFTATAPGIYEYAVDVCYIINNEQECKSESLKIHIIDTNIYNNKPIVNADVATLKTSLTGNDIISVQVLANDASGNDGSFIDPTSLVVNTLPINGTITINNDGTINYKPNIGFTGIDSFYYTVCEQPANTCDSTIVKIFVQENEDLLIITGDDFIKIEADKVFHSDNTNGLLINDYHLNGEVLSVHIVDTTIVGVGELVIDSDGSYTFTPDINFRGHFNFNYKVYTTSDTSIGNLYILVTPPFNPIYIAYPDFSVTYAGKSVSGDVSTNDKLPSSAIYAIHSTIDAPEANALTLYPDGTYAFTATTPGLYRYEIISCYNNSALGGFIDTCIIENFKISVLDTLTNTVYYPSINPDNATMVSSSTGNDSITINVTLNDGPGNKNGLLNNNLSIAVHPNNGVVTINADGTLSYKPNQNFVGIDEFWYNNCETVNGTTIICDSTKVSIDVQKSNIYSLNANDDYYVLLANQNTQFTASNGVTQNDISLNSNPISCIPQYTTVPEGSFILNADGSFSFTPTPNYYGPVTLIYFASNGVDTVQGTIHFLITPPESALGMSLVSFHVAANNCNEIQINWTTATEENLSHFNILYSVDGKNFQTVMKVNAANSILGYKYHSTYIQHTTKGYYKLEAVDIDNSKSYSKIATVSINCMNSEIEIYPNPTSNNLYIKNLLVNSVVKIFNINGSIIKSQIVDRTSTHLDISTFTPGTYIVEVINEDGNVFTSKFIKQ